MTTSTEPYTDLFRQIVNSYSPVTEASLGKLVSAMRCRVVAKDESILQIGQTARRFYFVCEGLLVSMLVNQQGKPHIKNFFTAGNFAGSTVSLLQASASAFSLQALADSIVLDIDYQRYKQLIYEHRDLTHFYIAYLEKNWVIANEKRQIAFATQTATERYLTFLEQYPDLDKQVYQLHIASYLGVTPTQLSRIRKELGLI